MSVLKEYPETFLSPRVWSGKDLEVTPEKFTSCFTQEEIGEVKTATKYFLGLGLSRGLACRETFPLSEPLAKRLDAVTDAVYNGIGFHLLKGLDLSQCTDEEKVIAYAGITSYVANKRARNIDHIRDRTLHNPRNETLKPNEQRVAMGFHTDIDVSDILSMFMITSPLEGGNQYLASIEYIYNILAAEDPTVLQTLKEDWYWEINFRPELGKEKLRTHTRPCIGMESGHLQVNYAGAFIGAQAAYPLSSAAPPLSDAQWHAIQGLQAAAKECCVCIRPEPGDVLFVNNYALLHARDDWVDSNADSNKTRYLMRLWLHDVNKGWKSSPHLKRDLGHNFDLPPEKQALLTGDEWDEVPRAWRVKSLGITAKDCHD